MNKDVIEVQVRAVVPLDASFAVFLGNSEKTYVIYVDEPVGSAISMFMRGVSKERPLTHDLLASVLLAFGAQVDRIVINEVAEGVFRARLIIVAENELHSRKLIEIDARPSDSIAMAVKCGAPIFTARAVWDAVDDMTEALEEIEARGQQATPMEEAEEEDDEESDDDEEDDFDEDFDFEDDDQDEDDDPEENPPRNR
jgi:bifunctional DNase/RNase